MLLPVFYDFGIYWLEIFLYDFLRKDFVPMVVMNRKRNSLNRNEIEKGSKFRNRALALV
jgi:hypothetical protein